MERLIVVAPGAAAGERFALTLEAGLKDSPCQILTGLDAPLRGRRLLFAVALDEGGVNPGLCALLSFLRTHPGALEGCVGGVLVDGPGDLYTKSTAGELILAANGAGCAFPGRPLVEAVGSLSNFAVQAKNGACDLQTAYRRAVSDLVHRILSFVPPKPERPQLLVLHASSRRTSNTLALWEGVASRLDERFQVTEVGLRNGTLEDCAGCPYTTCLHFGEQGGCFYGGVMVREVYPAVREADGVVLLCPNYNDALSANLTACINRLSALYRATSFTDKAVYAVVVSGYSGSDIVARQVIGALCMNKGFFLPPRFALLETANDAGSALRLPGIASRLDSFAALISRQFS